MRSPCRSSCGRLGDDDAAFLLGQHLGEFPPQKLEDSGVLGEGLQGLLKLAPVARQFVSRERVERMLRWLDGDGSGRDRFGGHRWLFLPGISWRGLLSMVGGRAYRCQDRTAVRSDRGARCDRFPLAGEGS